MTRILTTVICFFTLTSMYSQIHEVGIFAGGSNFIGDVGPTNYIRPNDLAIGAIYKWNRSTRHSWRASAIYSRISADDAKSDSPGRKQRGYSFENSVKEFSAGLEFNFFDFDLHQLNRQITPYVYGGVSYFMYDSMYLMKGLIEEDESKQSFAIPMVLGVKSNITPSLILAFEVGVRYTFADDMDGSNNEKEQYAPLKFGNINSKDWYTFTGFTLTYTFGNNPCFCPN